jgi:hypothetical protein
MIRTLAVALALWPTLASAETWYCDERIVSINSSHNNEWVISGDRMWALHGKGYWHVILNNDETLVAFVTLSSNDTRTTDYVVLDKKSGVEIGMNDVLRRLMGTNYSDDAQPPQVEAIGHCHWESSATPPQQPAPSLKSGGTGIPLQLGPH